MWVSSPFLKLVLVLACRHLPQIRIGVYILKFCSVQWWLQKLSGFIVNSTIAHTSHLWQRVHFLNLIVQYDASLTVKDSKVEKEILLYLFPTKFCLFFTLLLLITIWIYRKNFVGLMYIYVLLIFFSIKMNNQILLKSLCLSSPSPTSFQLQNK